MRVLVIGATGFIAGLLIPRLLESGHCVRALARHPERLRQRSWSAAVQIVSGDVLSPSTLAAALEGIDTAYYLVHSMSSGDGYARRDVEGARNFARAAADAGVRHVIYLGGLADTEHAVAAHMRSRADTGVALRETGIAVTEFRASVIAGRGSASFEMIRGIAERFPIIPGPTWLRNKAQPIAASNVVDYLVAALDRRAAQGQVFEIGGPEVLSYGELMLRYARARSLQRRLVLIPGLPVWLMAMGIGLLTPVPQMLAAPLVRALTSDSVVVHADAALVFPDVALMDFIAAARIALAEPAPDRAEQDNLASAAAAAHSAVRRLGEFVAPLRLSVAGALAVLPVVLQPLLRVLGS